MHRSIHNTVATVLTACGIETTRYYQYLLYGIALQQYLPLAVLKLKLILHKLNFFTNVATVLTACGIETLEALTGWFGDDLFSCNSTYRLRY